MLATGSPPWHRSRAMTRPPFPFPSVVLAAALAALLLAACTSVGSAGNGATTGRAEPPRKVLQGSIVYRERVALPDNAQVKLQLVDGARGTPNPAVAAETTFAAAGRQVPVPFSLPLDGVKTEPGRTYALQAYILVDGKIRYVMPGRVTIDPNALPTTLSVLMVPGSDDLPVADSPAPPSAAKPPSRSTLPRGSQNRAK